MILQVKGSGPFEVVETDMPIDGYTSMTLDEYRALVAAFVAPSEDAPSIPRTQSGATVIRRLTDAEIIALDSSSYPAAIRAKMLAQSEGVISEADQDFATLTGALDQLGIIAANRWTELLAP